jgi:hypothetical protein
MVLGSSGVSLMVCSMIASEFWHAGGTEQNSVGLVVYGTSAQVHYPVTMWENRRIGGGIMFSNPYTNYSSLLRVCVRLWLVLALLSATLGGASGTAAQGENDLPALAGDQAIISGETITVNASATAVASTKIGSVGVMIQNAALEGTRVTDGQQVLYTFEEGSGTTVYDVSGVGMPLDLTVGDVSAVSWVLGGLAVNAMTIIASEAVATKVIEAAQTTNEITVEAWVMPANTSQDGPARIVTLSADLFYRNFTLGQGLWGGQPSDLYDMRLRTTATDDSGLPSLSTPPGSLTTDLTHVVYTREASGMAKIYVDGVEQASRTVGGIFSNWDTGYRLALANELTEDRPWLGEFRLVAVFSRALSQAEVSQNFQAGPDSLENQRPVAVNDISSTDEDTLMGITVLANDRDPNGDTLSVSTVGVPTYGGVSTDGTTVTYTPANRTADYTAVFTYTASDGELADTATVTVTVAADNDAPVAVDDTDTTDEDTSVTVSVLTDDSDPDGDALTVSAVGTPTYGSVSTNGTTVTYTPINHTADYSAVFTYTASDGSLTDTATVLITVAADNDPPAAVSDAVAVNEDATTANLHATLLSNDTDPDAVDTQNIVSVDTSGTVGTVTFDDGTDSLTYTASGFDSLAAGATGMDTFAYTLGDGQGAQSTATVSVMVTGLNDAPTFTSTPLQDATVGTTYTYNIATHDVDVGDLLTITPLAQPGWLTLTDHGDGAATLTGTPGQADIGDYSVLLQVTDGAETATQPFTIRVREKAEYSIFLPFVFKRHVFAPDLVVEDLVATRNNVQVVIKNQGNAPVTDEFWVDVYIDPNPVPTAVNQTWGDLGNWGLVWGVTEQALPLQPGDVLTLAKGDEYYWAGLSSFPDKLEGGTPVYAQVDSANVATSYGAVLEIHEVIGEPYNNISGTVSTTRVTGADLPPAEGVSRPAWLGNLPPRP